MKQSISWVLLLISCWGLTYLPAVQGAELVEPAIFKQGTNQAFGRISQIDRIARDIYVGSHRFHVAIGAPLIGIDGNRLAFDNLQQGMRIGLNYRAADPMIAERIWIDGE